MTLAPAPPPAHTDKRRYVREMFSAIAPRYDLLNHLLSLNIDRSWRRKAVGRLEWEAHGPGRFLDACAGTLDLAAELANRRGFSGRVIAVDSAAPMLRRGAGKGAEGMVRAVGADALELPFRDGAFDGVTVGFGVRNLEDLDAGLREFHRVLKTGSRLVVLDFTTPPFALLRAPYYLYFRFILPLVGRLISGHPTAYAYLPASVAEFPPPGALARRMEGAGFRDCDFRLLTGGIAAIHWGQR